ncbi:MAG: EF-hand domain-containing protein [Gammaproteobacteria bacterium]|nr:EF-hand domain-containing protein [Gammaproteobacteria bacterium]MBU1600491.1 EF-hand domain-containing protein [Gammaproteobacteria bacterium]MBU2434947.1 EF-hand domain-containing protein [Gammaproteobacteria bacterium]MBU2448183.1 EF-hand domain-containing protein [Gammaproteobacteria bacterium]
MLSGINQASQMASMLFSKLDTKSQGYLEKSDLAAAFSQITSNASQSASSTSADDVFTALDSNSDGKVTKDEFATVLAKLQESVSSQFGGPMHGPGGMPPPPPADDAGFTKEELTSQLESADSSDTKRTELINKIVENFEAADTDSDGKVSFKEAMAYDKSTESTSASDTGTATATTTANNSDAELMMKIMQLMHAYGTGQDQENSGIATLLSVTA